MLFNGHALIFTFSGTQVRIAEHERLQSLFKMYMTLVLRRRCWATGRCWGRHMITPVAPTNEPIGRRLPDVLSDRELLLTVPNLSRRNTDLPLTRLIVKTQNDRSSVGEYNTGIVGKNTTSGIPTCRKMKFANIFASRFGPDLEASALEIDLERSLHLC